MILLRLALVDLQTLEDRPGERVVLVPVLDRTLPNVRGELADVPQEIFPIPLLEHRVHARAFATLMTVRMFAFARYFRSGVTGWSIRLQVIH